MGGSWLKYLLLIPLMLFTMPFVFCLLHKIIISYITKCMTEPPMKMMTRFEAVDQMYSSINDQWLSQCTSRYEKMQWEGILSWTITRRQVSRDLWLFRPSPVIAHWVSYQQKPSSELGMSLPSNMGQNGHEMPPKVWSDLWPQMALTKSTANDWTTKAFSICIYRDWTPCCFCWPSTIPEGVQGGVRHSVLQGIWWDRSSDSGMFLGTDFMISILASPHI